jgi:hypothetical protein
MQVTPFEFDSSTPAAQRDEHRREEPPRSARPAAQAEEDDHRPDEPTEEPGYGHGV